MFQQVDDAIRSARQNQIANLVELDQKFRDTTDKVDELKQAIATASGKENIDAFFGDTTAIKNANAEIERATTAVNKLFDALDHGNTSVKTVFDGIAMARQQLLQDGFGADAVDKFLNSLVHAHQQLDADISGSHQMNAAIQVIKDKIANITVVTRQIGTGTQSSYSVPTTYGGAESAGSGSSYGVTGSSNVNVTRYGSEGDSSAGFTSFERDMTSQTQQIAAASALNIKQGGLGFDTGGQIAPGGTQHVEFFKNPNERLIIARPDQFNDVRSQPSTEKTAANDIRPIVINQNHNWNGNAPPSKDSVAEMRRQTAQAVQDAMRAYVVDRSAQKPWNAPPEFAATVERNRAEFKAQFGSFEEAEIGPYWLSTSEDGAWLAFQSHRPDGSIHRFALPASMVPQFIVELAGATDEMNERCLAAALVAAEAKGGSLMPLLGIRLNLKRAWQRDQAGWSRPTDTASLAERSEYARILNASNRAAAKGVTARKAKVTAMKTDGMQIIPPGLEQTDSMMCPLMASSTLY